MAARPRNAAFKQTIPFSMYRVSTLTVAGAAERLAPFGINIQGARVLVVMLQSDEMRMGEVAEITCIELSTLSHMVRRFERDGLITRMRPPDDNRTVIVSLTPRGRMTASDVDAIVKEQQQTLLAGIAGRDIAVFRRVLDRMTANVEAAVRRA